MAGFDIPKSEGVDNVTSVALWETQAGTSKVELDTGSPNEALVISWVLTMGTNLGAKRNTQFCILLIYKV